MTSKGKYRVHRRSTAMSSDNEMETSFSSCETTTGKGVFNPLYGAGADSSDTELPRSEDGLNSKGRAPRRRIPRIRAR